MRPELRHVGASRSPVVVIDDFTGDLDPVLAAAEALAPYPPAGNNYPGIRRLIGDGDGAAWAYAEGLCQAAAQFIAGAYDVESFDLLEASFSIVTAAPEKLGPQQRLPHFDSTDPKHFALLHYLRVPPGSGTAFYRQRSTGIEQVSETNRDDFLRTAQTAALRLPPDSGYHAGSSEYFEQIGSVEAVSDRLVIYQGCLLHSGIIPPGMTLSGDPRDGRLTANIFVRGH